MRSSVPFHILFILLISAVTVTHANQTTSHTINPVITEFDSTFSLQKYSLPTFIQLVSDQSPQRDSTGIVGKTRIRRKKMVPIVCNPKPSECIQYSLNSMFAFKNCSVKSAEKADLIVSISVIECNLTESYNKITQTMDANITLNVSVTDTRRDNQSREFKVTSQNSYTTIDTTKHAEKVMRQAIKALLHEMLNNLITVSK